MAQILGDARVIERAKRAKPGDKTVYINWDLINDLPDQYEVILTEIKFDPKNLQANFSDVGNGNWMPKPEMMYRIANTCGINGGERSITQPIIEEVDINPMLMKDLTEQPTLKLMTVGRRVKKYSERLQEDGTMIKSSVCTCDYNVWERCCESWAKEEEYTDNYKKSGKYPPKYSTISKRKLHFQTEFKFAHAKAETKAHEKTIRELACLQTGYTQEDLKEGVLIFSKVRKSRSILRAETAARLAALSQGKQIEDNSEPVIELFPQKTKSKPEQAPEPRKPTKREELIATLEYYQKDKLYDSSLNDSVENLISWLKSNEDAEKDTRWWTKALDVLKEIEKTIPEQGRLTHSLLNR